MASKMTYQWASGAAIKLDPAVVGPHLEALRVRNNGHLTPEILLRDAESKRSPVHKFFVWDDAEAANKFRLEQAKYLLRSIVVTVKAMPSTKKKPVRAFVNVTKENVRSYTSITTAMSDKTLRKQVLAKALAELQSWRDRYAHLKELSEIFAAIDQMDDAA